MQMRLNKKPEDRAIGLSLNYYTNRRGNPCGCPSMLISLMVVLLRATTRVAPTVGKARTKDIRTTRATARVVYTVGTAEV